MKKSQNKKLRSRSVSHSGFVTALGLNILPNPDSESKVKITVCFCFFIALPLPGQVRQIQSNKKVALNFRATLLSQ